MATRVTARFPAALLLFPSCALMTKTHAQSFWAIAYGMSLILRDNNRAVRGRAYSPANPAPSSTQPTAASNTVTARRRRVRSQSCSAARTSRVRSGATR